MFPAMGFERVLALWSDEGYERAAVAGAEDAADARDRNASDEPGDAG